MTSKPHRVVGEKSKKISAIRGGSPPWPPLWVLAHTVVVGVSLCWAPCGLGWCWQWLAGPPPPPTPPPKSPPELQ